MRIDPCVGCGNYVDIATDHAEGCDEQRAIKRLARRRKLRADIGDIIFKTVEAAPMSFLADPDRTKYLSEFIIRQVEDAGWTPPNDE